MRNEMFVLSQILLLCPLDFHENFKHEQSGTLVMNRKIQTLEYERFILIKISLKVSNLLCRFSRAIVYC